MAAKRNFGIENKVHEPKEKPAPQSQAEPRPDKAENIDSLVSDFLAELTNLSSGMKSQAENPATVQQASGTAATGTQPGRIPLHVPESGDDRLREPGLEGIDDEIERSLTELENLKREKKAPAPEPPAVKPSETGAVSARPAAIPSRRTAPQVHDYEEQALDRLEMFRSSISTAGSRRRARIRIAILAVILILLALAGIFLFRDDAAAPEITGEVLMPAPVRSAQAAAMDEPSRPAAASFAPETRPREPAAGAPAVQTQPEKARRRALPAAGRNASANGPRRSAAADSVLPAIEASVPSAALPESAPAPSREQPLVEPAVLAQAPSLPARTPAAPAAPENPRPRVDLPAVSNHPVNPPPQAAAATAEVPAPRRRIPVPPAAITKVAPAYPALAKDQRVTGTVEIEAEIDAGGNVVKAQAVSGPVLLRGAAEEAVEQWQFRPASIEGQAVSSRARVFVSFDLK